MYKKGFLLVLSFSLLSLIVYLSSAHSKKETIPKDEASCYKSHWEIKSPKGGNQARESLPQFINAPQEGIKVLEKAIEEKRK